MSEGGDDRWWILLMRDPSKEPSLDALRTFIAAYRTRSFSGAATMLGLSQPTVTNRIAGLEKLVGSKLFERSASGSQPTIVAHDLAAAVGESVDRLVQAFSGDGDAREMRAVRVGAPLEYTTTAILPALAPVAASLPQLEFVFDRSVPNLELLTDGRLDLVITTARPRIEGVTSWPIGDEEFWLVAAPGVAPGSAAAADLRGLPLLALSKELPIIRTFWTYTYREEPQANAALIVPNLIALKAAAVGGYGVTVLPSYLVAEEVQAGQLVRLDSPEIDLINTVHLAAGALSLNNRPELRALITVIISRVKSFIATATDAS